MFNPKCEFAFIFVLLFTCFSAAAVGQDSNFSHDLIPVPQSISAGHRFPMPELIVVETNGTTDPQIKAALSRLQNKLAAITELKSKADQHSTIVSTSWTLSIHSNHSSHTIPEFGENESYHLKVSESGGTLTADNAYGIIHGLQTFQQLIKKETESAKKEDPKVNRYWLHSVIIDDQPRFPWRGLLLDVARHFQSVETIERTLDGMAAVKLNVLHLHLSDDHGFRVESTQYPALHRAASEGEYYTQAELRSLVQYAADRGIRIVPEFDMPGHSTAFLVALPHLASLPGPYNLAQTPGIFSGILDPSNEAVYDFIDRFITEMTGIFPDKYWHFGGDEVPAGVWEKSAEIREFMRQKDINDTAGLQAYFNSRLSKIISAHGKIGIGWEEITSPGLDQDTVIQYWKEQTPAATVLPNRNPVLVSRGYYLDHLRPASYHYLQDPLSSVSSMQSKNLLGAEAALWSETVIASNLDSRLWPRLAAIAERFWSPQSTTDLNDLYRRLAVFDRQLRQQGFQHQQIANSFIGTPVYDQHQGALEALESLVSITTPLAFNSYMSVRGLAKLSLPDWLNQYIDPPHLDGFSNNLQADSQTAYRFEALVKQFLQQPSKSSDSYQITQMLKQWREINQTLTAASDKHPQLRELQPLYEAVSTVAEVGLTALNSLTQSESNVASAQELQAGLELLQKYKPLGTSDLEHALRQRAFSWKPLVLKQTDIATVPAIELLTRAALASRLTHKQK